MASTPTPVMIFDDERTISCVFGSSATEDWSFTVGLGKITQIVAYREPGQAAHVPWFAVYEGDDITARLNAAHVEGINYV